MIIFSSAKVDSEDGGHERTPSEEPTSDAEPTSEEGEVL